MLADVSEIFESIQGEGIFVGVRQVFVRFSRCNLSCTYCDTPKGSEFCVDHVSGRLLRNPISSDYVSNVVSHLKVHSVSFTGGEPLLYADFIRAVRKVRPFYLETNMTLPENAKKVKHLVDFVAGDFKVREALPDFDYEGIVDRTVKCFRILRNGRGRVTFCKVVLPQRFDPEEIVSNVDLIKDYVCCVVLQPVFGHGDVDSILELQKRLMDLKETRVIPQVHKYLGVK